MPSESYRLKDKCLFVDANSYDEKNRKFANKNKPAKPPTSGKIELPHVMDKSTTPATYLMLNDAGAFIARFIVMGVALKDIPEILKSEYEGAVVNPAQDVADVYSMLAPYLEKRMVTRPYQAPKDEGKGEHSGQYDLDFRVNWFGTGKFKGPL
jgi:hypothetical protein